MDIAILSEHASSVDQVTVDYVDDYTAQVTGPLGDGRTNQMTYDANGFVASRAGWNGTAASHVRDAVGLELSLTEAAGTPEARTITTEWHVTFENRLALQSQIVLRSLLTTQKDAD